MKIRNSFVSNSSSSSFIIAYTKSNDTCKECGKKNLFQQFLKVYEKIGEGGWSCNSNKVSHDNAKSLLKDLKKQFKEDSDLKFIEEQIKKVEQAVKDGFEVAYLDCEMEDSNVYHEFFKLMESNGDIKILDYEEN